MSDRRVRATRKDREGDITKLCNSSQSWSPRSKADVISDIENNRHTYYVLTSDYERAEVIVVNGRYGKYLRTNRDTTTRNNLDNLPDC